MCDTTGTHVEILPLRFASPALSASTVAHDLAMNISHAEEDRSSLRRIAEMYKRDVLVPHAAYLKGFKIRIGGKLTQGMANKGFTLRGGSTHTTSFHHNNVDVAVAHAQTRIGMVGVKVWLMYHAMPFANAQPQSEYWERERERKEGGGGGGGGGGRGGGRGRGGR